MSPLNTYVKAIELIAGILSAIALAIVCIEVCLRYFFPHLLPDWGREVVIYLFAWALMLVGGLLVKEDKHVRADLLSSIFPKSALKFFDVIVAAGGLIFCATLTYFGWETVLFAREFGELSDSSIQFPMHYFYLCLPAGMLLMALHYCAVLITAVREVLTPTTEPGR